MRTGVLRGALATLLALGAFTAAASPGNGIRLGGSSGRLHPFLDLEGRYDSNVAYTDVGKSVSAFVLHVRPGLTLDSPGEVYAVKLKADVDWAQVLGSQSKLSRLYGESQLELGLNRRGQVGFELTDAFSRSASTQALTLGTGVISNTNLLRIEVPFRPGGGALVTTPSLSSRLETFEPFDRGRLCLDADPACTPAQLSKLGYSDFTAGLESRWKFLPRTAALVQGEYYLHRPVSTAFGDDGSGLRAWLGVAGLFGAHLAGTAKGGYGDTLGSFGEGFRTWLANVEAEWIPFETASAKLGYLHDFGADPGKASLFESHRVYADGHVLLEARYTARFSASYEHRSYVFVKGAAVDVIQLQPSAEMELARWLRAGAGYVLSTRTTKQGASTLPGYKFTKHEVFLRLTGTY
jgi:hypothetical protein